MITSTSMYNGVNLILGVICLVSIILAFKAIPDKRVKLFLVLACVLIIFSGALLMFCLKVFKMYTLAWTASTLRVEGKEDAFEQVLMFKDLSLVGYILEVAAIGLFAGAAKRLISLKAGRETEGGTAQ